jgi:chloramphenicol-sensitive protein RarD
MKIGYVYALLAYAAWGVLPIYWKVFSSIGAWEILSHRVLWSALFVLLLVLCKKRGSEIKQLLSDKKNRITLTISSLLISANWVIYIWAVNNGYVIEASLGYYINPLVNVMLGVLFLRERLKGLQWVAITLATIGMMILTISYRHFPWISISLAFTFGLYGLAKKKVHVDTTVGLMVETLLVLPIALVYLIVFEQGGQAWHMLSGWRLFVLCLSGVATALPLLWFTEAAKRLPLSVLGFIQYLAPTIMLILGVVIYHEPFTNMGMISFGFIWSALIIYTFHLTKNRISQNKRAIQA